MSRPVFRPDLTPTQVALVLGYANADAFLERRDDYARAGLKADPFTGRYDPEAFERWRRLRSPGLFPELTASNGARDARSVFEQRLRGG
ncbi:MAG: hypothetical protein P4L82_12165 [Ancalomicrobiaceae bacterium]|nr:hypothetical protein [Ancalomicrobiaceae bacterium]